MMDEFTVGMSKMTDNCKNISVPYKPSYRHHGEDKAEKDSLALIFIDLIMASHDQVIAEAIKVPF